MGIVLSIVNQKGGVGKTNVTANLGIGLAREGKRVLLIDADPQGSLTTSLGWQEHGKIDITIADVMAAIMEEKPLPAGNGILTEHPEGVHVVPATTRLARVEVELVTEIVGQTILQQYIDKVRSQYDYIIIDCQPSLGMLTLNTLTAADKLIIPVQAQYLALKGLEQLLHTVAKVKKSINPKLKIAGILLTMVDARTNYARETMDLLDETYGGKINIFDTRIPQAVKLSEITTMGKSIFAHCPGSKAAVAYENLTEEVIALEKGNGRKGR